MFFCIGVVNCHFECDVEVYRYGQRGELCVSMWPIICMACILVGGNVWSHRRGNVARKIGRLIWTVP